MTIHPFPSVRTAVAALAGIIAAIPWQTSASPDVIAPTVEIVTPAPGTTLAGRSIAAVSGTMADDVGVTAVQLTIRRNSDGKYWDDVGGWSDLVVLLPVSANGEDGTWTSTGRMPWLASGVYTITVQATDGTNSGEANAEVTVAEPELKFVNLTSLLPAGSSQVRILSLSWDGSVAVGQALIPGATVKRAFRWSEANGIEILADPPGGTAYTDAKAVSADGQVIVGAASSTASVALSSSGQEATVWNGPSSSTGAGDISHSATGDNINSLFYAVSADGGAAAGFGTYKNPAKTFNDLAPIRWTAAGGFQELGDLPGGAATGEAKGISADGAIVAGYSNATATDGLSGATRLQAFRWTEADGMEALPDMQKTFPSGFVTNRRSSAHGISADGSTIFGYWAEDVEDYNSSEATRVHAVIWRGSNVTPLGQLFDGYYDRYSLARSASGDGRVLVGTAAVNLTLSRYEAFIWREGTGISSLQTELAPYWNLNLPGYLSDATAISADGHTIAGVGKDSQSAAEFAWILTVPRVLPTPPPPPPPPPPPTAPDGNMLTKTATFTPKITFTESYSESVKTVTEVIEGETFVNHEVVGAGSNSATIVASMAEIDLASIDESTEVLVTLGTFLHSATLGEDMAYRKGKTSATFKLTGFDTYGNEVSEGTVKYAWTKTTLTVTITCSRSPDFPIAFQDFPALLPTAPPNNRSAPFSDLVEASVGFGETGGTCSDIYVTGKVTGSVKVFGSGDSAEQYDLVSATISGGADYDAPVVAFTAPAANFRTTSDTVDVAGTVKDAHLTDKVLMRVNGGDFFEVTPTMSTGSMVATWECPDVLLIAGPNLIEAKAADASGNESAVVSRKVTRVVMKPLAVSHEGSGSVSAKYEPTSSREIGAAYSITATPGKGYVFDGWTGVVSDQAKLTFTMTDGLQLVAHFIPNPFPEIVGDYRGLVIGGNPSAFAENGAFSFKPTATGTLTFKLSLGTASYTATGVKLHNDGSASFSISRGSKLPALQVTLQVTMDLGDGHVSGTITSTGLSATLSGDRTVIDAAHPVPAGAYTLLFPTVLAEPQGLLKGTASLVISSAGGVTMTGRLWDNSSFTMTSNISKSGAIPLFGKIGTGAATRILSGLLQYDGIQGAPGGALHVLAGIDSDTPLSGVGSLYTPPAAKKRVLDSLDASNGAALVTLSDGGLAAPIIKSATISTAAAVVVTPAGTQRLTLTIVPKLGTFTGSFLPPGTTKTVPISGVFFENMSAGLGLFTPAIGDAGQVKIEAAP